MVGFCIVEVKELGPPQTWLVPPVDEEVRFIVPPTNTGELLPAVTAVGGVQTAGVMVKVAGLRILVLHAKPLLQPACA